jgi:hypothetical protein
LDIEVVNCRSDLVGEVRAYLSKGVLSVRDGERVKEVAGTMKARDAGPSFRLCSTNSHSNVLLPLPISPRSSTFRPGVERTAS